MPTNTHVAVIGLSFGDEGKGSVTDFLASTGKYAHVIKTSGGAQCAHHVVREDGAVHRFAQFGSGTFWGLPTHLSKFFLVEPMSLATEGNVLSALGVRDPYSLLTVDERCLVTTPFHRVVNCIKESARDKPHGSCGVGIGETMRYSLNFDRYALRVRDFRDKDLLFKKLSLLRQWAHGYVDPYVEAEPLDDLIEVYSAFADTVKIVPPEHLATIVNKEWAIFEGSQGVLLDEWHGLHPNTTWATTTFDNTRLLMEEAENTGPVLGLGCLRAYTTRHGHGPFPTEDETILEARPEEHNGTGKFQGAWRAGHFDAVLHRYAWRVVKDTFYHYKLAITHLDRPAEKICTSYMIDGMSVTNLIPQPGQRRTTNSDELAYQRTLGGALYRATPVYQDMNYWSGGPVKNIEGVIDADCVIESYGPKASNKKSIL